MYTRSFYPEEKQRISLPDDYSGTAFGEEARQGEFSDEEKKDFDEKSTEAMGPLKEPSGLLSIFERLPFGGIFKSGEKFKIGTEELIILGIAALLLFSKDGDKECAIWLLILLFI